MSIITLCDFLPLKKINYLMSYELTINYVTNKALDSLLYFLASFTEKPNQTVSFFGVFRHDYYFKYALAVAYQFSLSEQSHWLLRARSAIGDNTTCFRFVLVLYVCT